jgi:hypothetical protein
MRTYSYFANLHLKRVFDVDYLRFERFDAVRRVHLYHVKTRLKLRSVRVQPKLRRYAYPPLLRRAYEFARFAEISVLPHFHLYEYDEPAAFDDEVNFPEACAVALPRIGVRYRYENNNRYAAI